jgi:hypothetical protein
VEREDQKEVKGSMKMRLILVAMFCLAPTSAFARGTRLLRLLSFPQINSSHHHLQDPETNLRDRDLAEFKSQVVC